jgi:isoaspartyl peptidase/L-asparaginase-like protein (Ntn-hydrolase superfamily)
MLYIQKLNPLNDSSILFFIGYGSVLNVDGEVEMDAIIMEGRELKTGVYGLSAYFNLQVPFVIHLY